MTTEDSFFIHNRTRRRRLLAAWFCDYFLLGIFYRQILHDIHYKRLVANPGNLGLQRDQDSEQSGPFIATIDGYVVKVRFGWRYGFVISATPNSADFRRNRNSNGLPRGPQLRLFLEKSRSVPYGNENDVDLNTDNRIFNFIFNLRRADSHTVKVLTASPDLLDHFVRFYEKWMDSLSSFAVNETQFTCALPHVGVFYKGTTEAIFKDLLTDLIRLVAHFDDEMKKREFKWENINIEKARSNKA